jgi:hypothetical protein
MYRAIVLLLLAAVGVVGYECGVHPSCTRLSPAEARAVSGGDCFATINAESCISGAVPDACSSASSSCSSYQCAGTCPTQTKQYSHVTSGGSYRYEYSTGSNPCGTFTCKPCIDKAVGSGCVCALVGSATFNCKYKTAHTWATSNCDM